MKERNGAVDNSHISLGRATSLTGDPVDMGRVHEGTVDHGSETDFDFAIPGLDPDAVAPDGVDAGADDEGCEGGACKI